MMTVTSTICFASPWVIKAEGEKELRLFFALSNVSSRSSSIGSDDDDAFVATVVLLDAWCGVFIPR
jgi:hypothetical protein